MYLSFIRTSPDHGTAYEIAGTNQADENSFRTAIFLAIDVFNNRELNKELKLNPLKVSEADKRYDENDRRSRVV